MKKFKTIFYGIYIFYFAFCAFIGLYYEQFVLHWDWDWISTWTGLIRFVLQLGGIGTVLFITEIIIENIHLLSKRTRIKAMEKEIVDLKAKLYDQSNDKQQETSVEPSPDPIKEEHSDNAPQPKED